MTGKNLDELKTIMAWVFQKEKWIPKKELKVLPLVAESTQVKIQKGYNPVMEKNNREYFKQEGMSSDHYLP